MLGKQRNSDPHYRLCPSPVESTKHILTECCATAEVRDRLFPELLNVIAVIDTA